MAETPALQNKKTILVVDDDAIILGFVAECLAANYDVLTAASGEQALRQSKDFKDEIHRLSSNLEMTGMTGIDLATNITAQRPQLKVLLMSGFSGGMLVLNGKWHFLPKPFIPSQLRTLVADPISPNETRFKAA